MRREATDHLAGVRIGAVTYLNSRPLIFCLQRLIPGARIILDVPSALADALAAGELDVSLIPSIEYLAHRGYAVVSDACIACDGPVRSVKLYSRVPVEGIRSLALDEGSRTSAALVRILLKERFGLEPQWCRLPIGASLAEATADAAMLVGDRGMLPAAGKFAFVWDLGEEWSRWTGLPFVFALWVARSMADERGIDLQRLGELLSAARDEGVAHLAEIARREAPAIGLSEAECVAYLRENLCFRLGERQRQGLQRFCELAERHRLIGPGKQ